MIEYGLLAGAGSGLGGLFWTALDALSRAGRDLLDLALEHPLVSLAVILPIAALLLSRRRR